MFDKKENKKAFTLIELLVVIAVIALLMAIVLPSLGKAKIYAQKVVCRSNIRQLGLGVLLYADQNEDEVPINTLWSGQKAAWFWDVSFWMTDQIINYGDLVPEVFFCPSVRDKKPDDARWWQYSMIGNETSEVSYLDESGMTIAEKCSEYRVLPYIFLIDLVEMNPSDGNYGQSYRSPITGDPGFEWIRKLSRLRHSGSRVMVMDSVLSGDAALGGQAFNEITSGGADDKYGLTDSTCHLTRQTYSAGVGCPQNPAVQTGRKPDGSNICYADGHVEWRPFEEMRLQIDNDYTDFYW